MSTSPEQALPLQHDLRNGTCSERRDTNPSELSQPAPHLQALGFYYDLLFRNNSIEHRASLAEVHESQHLISILISSGEGERWELSQTLQSFTLEVKQAPGETDSSPLIPHQWLHLFTAALVLPAVGARKWPGMPQESQVLQQLPSGTGKVNSTKNKKANWRP